MIQLLDIDNIRFLIEVIMLCGTETLSLLLSLVFTNIGMW